MRIPPTDHLASVATGLTREEVLRYSRHLLLPDVGREGQERLKGARVIVIGAGGLGSPALMYLAAAGVGVLGLVDFDVVDESNLQRQVLHGSTAVGKSKLTSARARLEDLNRNVEIIGYDTRLTSQNAMEIIESFDLVVDGSDNFPTRYLVNDACVLLGKPYVYGAIFRFEGQVSVFAAEGGPCYRCLFREPPPPGLVPSCDEAGVLGVLPGVIGSLQALEAIKLVLRLGEPLVGRLVVFDGLKHEFREVELRRDPTCPVCGDNPTVRSLIDYEEFCGVAPPMVRPAKEVSVSEFSGELRGRDDVLLLDVREPLEWNICRIEGAVLIPLGQLPSRLSELDPSKLIVTQCHTGVRSYRALEVLEAAGFSRVRNLRGGIEAWAVAVEPEMPRY